MQIGLLTGVPPLVTLFARPFLTGIAEATQRHNLIMGAGILGGAVLVFSISQFTNFAAIFLLVLAFNIFFSPVASLGDSATMSMLGEERTMYGRIRLGAHLSGGYLPKLPGFCSIGMV